ncbi:MAG: MMPL family transporter [Gammaproteobacteria bacterium]|nr:MMPL family transporter [Gammaproteobacteria bacterium]
MEDCLRITTEDILRVVIPIVYARRRLTFGILLTLTALLLACGLQLKPDAGFEKQIPLRHEYMQVFKRYEKAFGGANLVSIALLNRNGDIYEERFLDTLKKATDEVFFLPGVDRSRVSSLFTPGVRYIEIVEGGLEIGDVVPRNYAPTPEMFQLIRENVGKAGAIGRLVSADQRGAMIVAELLEYHPVTGEKLDYRYVAGELERIRAKFQSDDISIHIIGFAKVVGDVTAASSEVAAYFVVTLALTALLLWAFCGSFRLSLLPLFAALAAVVWELGLLRLAGFGLDPFAILVPFLILSIGVSHGVQYINAWGHEVAENGLGSFDASVQTFRRLAIPGTVAILTDVIGFATLAFIKIDIVREMAINAAMGMAAVIITNKMMLPIGLTWMELPDIDKFKRRQLMRQRVGDRIWREVAACTTPRVAVPLLAAAALAFGWAIWKYPDLRVGDVQVGVPELKPDGRYNRDAALIVRNFAIGVDVLKVVAETREYGCVDHAVLDTVDRYAWHVQNAPGVRSVLSLPQLARQVRGMWNEAAPKWAVLPRNQSALAQIVSPIPSAMGLQNPDCSAMPVLVFTTDHKAETIAGIVEATRRFNADNPDAGVRFALASGNVGVMAATNEEIQARELTVIIWVHATLAVFAWLSFRTLVSVVSIITPLVLCSLLTYGFMAVLQIGMKPATLPVAAFGVGIGVDYSIYLWSVFARYLEEEHRPLRESYYEALRHTGKAVVFTSLSLIVAVFTWLFSGLQFQADMGLLLLFMFTTNLFGAIFLLPAIAWLMLRRGAHAAASAPAPLQQRHSPGESA